LVGYSFAGAEPVTTEQTIIGADDRLDPKSYLTPQEDERYNGIAMIACDVPNATDKDPKATGVLIGDRRHLLTAKHVYEGIVDELNAGLTCYAYFLNSMGKKIDRQNIIKVKAKPKEEKYISSSRTHNDWIILEISEASSKITPLAPIKADFFKDADILMCGHHLDLPDMERKRCLEGTARHSGIETGSRNPNVLTHDIDSPHGSSGSPLFYADRPTEIIAINVIAACLPKIKEYEKNLCSAEAIFFTDEFFEKYDAIFGKR
jgi:V8-like Glu-specific endopeptidase